MKLREIMSYLFPIDDTQEPPKPEKQPEKVPEVVRPFVTKLAHMILEGDCKNEEGWEFALETDLRAKLEISPMRDVYYSMSHWFPSLSLLLGEHPVSLNEAEEKELWNAIRKVSDARIAVERAKRESEIAKITARIERYKIKERS